MERHQQSPLSPKRLRYEGPPPGSPSPKTRLRFLHKQIPTRTRENVIKVRDHLDQHLQLSLTRQL